MKSKDIFLTANCFGAILGTIRNKIQRRQAPRMSDAGELVAECRDVAGHD